LDDAIVDRRVRRRRYQPHRGLEVGNAFSRPFEEASHFDEYRRVRLLDLPASPLGVDSDARSA